MHSRVPAAALALAASAALAHVIMVEPHPYNLDTEPLYQTWPLGSDLPFPCQGRSQHAEHVTTVTAGSSVTVRFWGSAVHGGGACQFSIAYGDTPPADPAAWKTIYSIVGGCPAEAAGNLPTVARDPHGREQGPTCGNSVDRECLRQFDVPIPAAMPDGPAVFAWTWFNRIGNREMYMTCAPIVVTGGGAGNASFVEALPPVFRANIPGECTTGPSGNLIGFPDPGLYGVLYDAPAPGSSGSCPPGVAPVFEGDPPDQGRGSVAASTTTPLPGVGSSSPSQTPETASYAASPLPESSPKPATISPAPTPVTGGSDARPAPTLPSAAPTGAPSGDRPDWAAGMVPCSPAGELVCLEPGFFGICNHGWTVPQRLAADQVCVDGSVELAEPR